MKGTGWYDEKSQVLIAADPEYEPIENNHKLKFSQWMNVGENKATIEDAKSPTTTLVVTDYLTLEAKYDDFWYLKIISAYGNPFGQGYYRAGETAKIAVTSPANVIPEESRLIFDGWGGDSNSTDAQLELVMDGYKELTANWKEQYYLKTVSRYLGVEGGGWYDKGSIAKFEVHNPQNGGIGRQILFQQWLGDFHNTSKKGEILMDKPQTVIANFHEDASMLYYIIGAIVVIIAIPSALHSVKPKMLGTLLSKSKSKILSKKNAKGRRNKNRLSSAKLRLPRQTKVK